jgi:FtsX-like permease family
MLNNGENRGAKFIATSSLRLLVYYATTSTSQIGQDLVRLGTRQKEMAMRATLGAGRSRLLRQMLTESVALSCCGAVLGLAVTRKEPVRRNSQRPPGGAGSQSCE